MKDVKLKYIEKTYLTQTGGLDTRYGAYVDAFTRINGLYDQIELQEFIVNQTTWQYHFPEIFHTIHMVRWNI